VPFPPKRVDEGPFPKISQPGMHVDWDVIA
jgi:hypothetical protein